MTTTPKRRSFRDADGAVLFLALGIMVIMLSLSLMFASLSIKGHKITGNQLDAFRARTIAEAGIEKALSQLASNPAFMGNIASTSFDGGTYTVEKRSTGSEEVTVTSVGTYNSTTSEVTIAVTIPPASGTVDIWALREGVSEGSWDDSYDAHDDATGRNYDFASLMVEGVGDHGLGGFRVEPVARPIQTVGIIVYFYLPRTLKGGDLYVRWRNVAENRQGPWKKISSSTLNQAYYYYDGHAGFLLDTTGDAPAGGWTWEAFETPTFQIDVRTKELDAYYGYYDKIYIDCVGFRVTW